MVENTKRKIDICCDKPNNNKNKNIKNYTESKKAPLFTKRQLHPRTLMHMHTNIHTYADTYAQTFTLTTTPA